MTISGVPDVSEILLPLYFGSTNRPTRPAGYLGNRLPIDTAYIPERFETSGPL